MNLESLLDAWCVNNGVNLELLDACSDDWLELKPGKGKTIRSNFAHIVSIRRSWIEEKMRSEAQAVPKLDWKTASRAEIRDGLEVSSALTEVLFAKRESSPPKGGWTTLRFFAYMIAHEANHRAQIEIALRLGGHELDEAFLYRLWDWGRR